MIFKSVARIVVVTIFASTLVAGCMSNVDQLAISTCKAVETSIKKCSELIADDISYKNAQTQSSIDEGDL